KQVVQCGLMDDTMPTTVSTLIAVALAVCAGCAPDDGPWIPSFEACEAPVLAPDDLVEFEAGIFTAGGEEFLPHGINSYPLLQHVGNGELEAVRDILGQAGSLGRRFLRTNAFMDGGDNPARIRDDDGTIREEGLAALDLVVAEAAGADVRLLLLLTNNWEDFGGAQAVVNAAAPGEGLPKDAFWSEPRAVAAQLDYVRTIALRTNTVSGRPYAADPSILGWELANEARCDDPDWCAVDALPSWAAAMSDELRDAGARQPIFWGGAGYLGEHGEDLRDIGGDGGVDVLTLHLYLHHSHPYLENLPASQRISEAVDIGAGIIRERAAVADEAGLPLVIEELGWRPPAGADRDAERAAIFEGWLAVAHHEGLATMPWMIGETGREDFDGLLIRPTDELTWAVLSCR
ncbi:MAG TPA: cellulase family glycosylhydrolase, partial [Polyangia bacterium]|nr:cellulase family glycosylhydrolase [Polyangia bacterium]